MSRAWLITPPHPDPRYRRRIVRRVAGRIVTLYRVPVMCVDVMTLLPELQLARVRDRETGSEFYGRFAHLASTREKFAARLVELAGVIENGPAPSGVAQMPATTAPDRSNP